MCLNGKSCWNRQFWYTVDGAIAIDDDDVGGGAGDDDADDNDSDDANWLTMGTMMRC